MIVTLIKTLARFPTSGRKVPEFDDETKPPAADRLQLPDYLHG